MKKLFYLLFLLPLAFFAACDDDDNLPAVDFTLTLDNVTQYEKGFYAVKGDTVIVDGVSVKPIDNGKAATVTGVRYFLDYMPIMTDPILAPFTTKFLTEDLPARTYNFGITATVLQVDKSISNVAINVPLTIVENKEQLPEGAPEIGEYSVTMRIQPKK